MLIPRYAAIYETKSPGLCCVNQFRLQTQLIKKQVVSLIWSPAEARVFSTGISGIFIAIAQILLG